VGIRFDANEGSVVNISGGTVGDGFNARSLVNISGGTIGDDFDAQNNSVVNISGGSVGHRDFDASAGSEVNLFGSDFVLDGVPLDASLTIGDAFTIDSRNVTLSGILADGTAFSFDLSNDFFSDDEFFSISATVTVTLGPPTVLGDVNQDGDVTFADIGPFIAVLQAGTFLGLTFADIPAFIAILQAG